MLYFQLQISQIQDKPVKKPGRGESGPLLGPSTFTSTQKIDNLLTSKSW